MSFLELKNAVMMTAVAAMSEGVFNINPTINK